MKDLLALAPDIELFGPDIFAAIEPEYAAASPASAVETIAVLECHYRHLGPVVGQLRQPRGAEINSRNIVADLASGVVVMKRLPTGGAKAMQAKLEVAEKVRAAGIAVPAVQPSSDGLSVVSHGGHDWFVLDFVAGRYFHGGRKELASVSTAVAELHAALGDLGPWSDPDGPVPVPDHADARFIEEFDSRRSDWDSLLGAHAVLLSRGWALIRECLHRVLSVRDELACVGTCHIDLHPHNLLMRDGSVAAILDFASIRSASVPVMETFAAYKLLRQSVALSGSRQERGQSRAMAEEFLSALGAGDAAAVAPAVLAQTEILRRLLFILRAAFYADDHSWSHVLPVHVAGLVESEMMLVSMSSAD